jgi:Mn2+/Fe2+ NRAMP family transporter
MSLVFFCYVISVILAKPNWSLVVEGFVKPRFSVESEYLFLIVALIGTTITPFMQVFVQSSVVEKGLTKDDYPVARADVLIGTVFSCAIAAFIVIATAATLHQTGIREIDSAATAAQALAPVVGKYATYLFAIGLLGASMLAMGVLPLAPAYSLSEALGFEKGVSNTFREAPIFLGIFTALILAGAGIALVPHIPQIRLLLFTQCVNGLLLPVLLLAVLRLANNRELLGEFANTFRFNLVAVTVAIAVSALSIMLIVKTLADSL